MEDARLDPKELRSFPEILHMLGPRVLRRDIYRYRGTLPASASFHIMSECRLFGGILRKGKVGGRG
jgi:hypothetical protein